jgi:O-antigen ligase
VNTARLRLHADEHVALTAVALLGGGAVVAVTGFAAGRLPLSVIGIAAAGVGFILLAMTGTIDVLAAVLVTLPLPALYASDTVRLTIVAPATAAVVIAWYCRRGLMDRPIEIGTLPRRSGIALIGVLILASAFAVAPAVSLRELLNLLVMAAFLVAAVDMLRREPGRRDALVVTLVAIAGLTGIVATLEALAVIPGEFPRWGTSFQRAAVGFGQPNGLGLFLALAVPFAVHVRAQARTPLARFLATAALLAIGVGMVGTFSRSAWLSTFLGVSVLFLAHNPRRVFRLWGAVLIGAILLDVVSGGAIRDTFVRTIGDWVVEQRAALALAGLAMFAEHPLLGVGPGGYAVMIEHYGAQISTLWDYLPTPHNVYIQIAAEAGIGALVAYVVFLAGVLRAHVRGARRAAALHGPTAPETSLREAAAWAVAVGVFAGMAITPFAHGTGQLFAIAIAVGCALPEDA